MSSNRCELPRCTKRGEVTPVLVVVDDLGQELGREEIDIRFCRPHGDGIGVGHMLTKEQWPQIRNKYGALGIADPGRSRVELVDIPLPSPRTRSAT